MAKTPDFNPAVDPVDWFAKEVLKHPDRIDDLKTGLRHRMGLGAATAVASHDDQDLEDLWDNVPI